MKQFLDKNQIHKLESLGLPSGNLVMIKSGEYDKLGSPLMMYTLTIGELIERLHSFIDARLITISGSSCILSTLIVSDIINKKFNECIDLIDNLFDAYMFCIRTNIIK